MSRGNDVSPSWEKAREAEIVDQEQTEAEIARQVEKERLAMGHKKTHARGGVYFPDRRMIAFQRQVFLSFISSLGARLVNRQDLSRVSLPVKLFEPRSYLQRLTDGWVVAPDLWHPCAEGDPVQQMKAVIAFSVAGLLQTVTNWKPFNPILGETYQCSLPDGTLMQLEQTSHHPPISHWLVEPANEQWVFSGHARWHSSFKGNAVRGGQGGENKIVFKNGTTITWNNPEFCLAGCLWGDRIAEYRGDVKFVDEEHGIEATLTYDPDRPSYLKSFFVSAASRSDSFRGAIYRDETEISSISGSWLTHIDFDGEKFFDIKNHDFPKVTELDDSLLSDSKYRHDLIALREGNYDKSQAYKVYLEEVQRRDRRLRAGTVKEIKIADSPPSSDAAGDPPDASISPRYSPYAIPSTPGATADSAAGKLSPNGVENGVEQNGVDQPSLPTPAILPRGKSKKKKKDKGKKKRKKQKESKPSK